MEINRHNYEAFLLDLLEGILSVEHRQQLDEFLLLNPDCAGELTEQETWFLEIEKVSFPGAGALKKELPNGSSQLKDHNFDIFSIARMEGDLTGQQEEAYRAMVEADAHKYNEWIAWQSTRLIPEPVLLKKKKQLYHRKSSESRVLWISVVSAAAAIALFILLFRMGPLMPEEELSQEVLHGTESGQVLETPDPPELQKKETKPVQVQPVQETTHRPVQKSGSTAMFSVKKEHELPAEAQKIKAPKDDMQPRPIRISENEMIAAVVPAEAVADRIEIIKIPPVSIHLSSLTIAQLAELDTRELIDNYTEERDFSLWTIANAGLKGINRITGSDISLMASRDEEGEVSGFQLKSKRFSMTRPLGREE